MPTLAKRRILVTRFPYESRLGGEEIHTLTVAKALRERGHSVFFMGSCPILLKEFQNKNFPVLKAWLSKPPVTLLRLLLFTLLSPILFLYAGFLLMKARSQFKVDTLYALSLGEKLLVTPWALLFKMRVLWWEHARIGAWLKKNPWRLFYGLWSRWATVCVTSQAMKSFLSFARHVQWIPCGVHLAPAEKLPQNFTEFLKEDFVVGTVSRLTIDKGVDKVVTAVHSIPNLRLAIVGNGPLKASILESISEEKMALIDSLSPGQLHTFYGSLDLFILASPEFDPFGMVAAEAMLAGCPTIVSEHCGIAQEMKTSEEIFVISAKVEAIQETIKKLKEDPSLTHSVAQAGQKKIAQNYNENVMVDAIEKLLAE